MSPDESKSSVSSRVEQLCLSCAHSADGLGSDIENAQITLGEGPYVDAATSLVPPAEDDSGREPPDE